MAASLSIIICTAVAVTTIGLFLLQAMEQRRLEESTLDDALKIAEGVSKDFADLPNLQGKQRQAKCKSIVKGMLLNVQFIIQFTFQVSLEGGEENPEVMKRR